MHLPVAVLLIFLDNFYALANTEGDLVVILCDIVVSAVNVFDHKEMCGEAVVCVKKGREMNRVDGEGQ